MNEQLIRKVSKGVKSLRVLNQPLRSNGRHQRVIVTYHGFSKNPKFSCVTRDAFRVQLAWLKETYTIVSLSDFVADLLSETPKQENLAAITVDDGYENFMDIALPLLDDHQFHSTIFIPIGKVGGYNDWDEKLAGFQKLRIMDCAALQKMPSNLVEIGSHGISHVPFNTLSKEEVAREIIHSRLEIEDYIGRPVSLIAFPFGVFPFGKRWNFYQWGYEQLQSYTAACTTWWGRFNTYKDRYTLRRIGIDSEDSIEDFQDKLQGHYDWLCAKEKAGRFLKYLKAFL